MLKGPMTDCGPQSASYPVSEWKHASMVLGLQNKADDKILDRIVVADAKSSSVDSQSNPPLKILCGIYTMEQSHRYYQCQGYS